MEAIAASRMTTRRLRSEVGAAGCTQPTLGGAADTRQRGQDDLDMHSVCLRRPDDLDTPAARGYRPCLIQRAARREGTRGAAHVLQVQALGGRGFRWAPLPVPK